MSGYQQSAEARIALDNLSALRNLCNWTDHERDHEADWCLIHGVGMPIGEPCPVVIDTITRIVAGELRQAAADFPPPRRGAREKYGNGHHLSHTDPKRWLRNLADTYQWEEGDA